MLEDQRWLPIFIAFTGMGILPLSSNPVKRNAVYIISFLWGVILICSSNWSAKYWLLKYLKQPVFIYRFLRFKVFYVVIWLSVRRVFHLTCRLKALSETFPDSLPSTQHKVSKNCSKGLLLFAVLVWVCDMAQSAGILRTRNQIVVSFIIHKTLMNFINFLIPTLYIVFIDQFTILFKKASFLWNTELDKVLAGSLESNLQDCRIFHTEVSVGLKSFKDAFGLILLLYFGRIFIDVLLGFQSFTHDFDEYGEFLFMTFHGFVSVFIMIKFTQDMVTASEDITTSLRNLKLSTLPYMDQLQVELLVLKLRHRPVEMEVCNILRVNRQLIVELIMGATTCCNALVQLRPLLVLKSTQNNTWNCSSYSYNNCSNCSQH